MNIKTIFTNILAGTTSVYHNVDRTMDQAIARSITLIRNITRDFDSADPEVYTVTPTMKIFRWKDYLVTTLQD